MFEKAKCWILKILLALVTLLGVILMAKKPKWVQEKEKDVEKREETIKKAKQQAGRAENYYKEMVKKHDEEIKDAGQKPEKPDIDNPDDAADFIDGILSNNGS